MRSLTLSFGFLVLAMAACDHGSHRGGQGGTAGASSVETGGFGGTAGVITLTPLGHPSLSPSEQTGNPKAEILASGQAFPTILAMDQASLYWFNLGSNPQLDFELDRSPWIEGQVMTCAKSGCANAPTILASDRISRFGSIDAFLTDGTNIYWNDDTKTALRDTNDKPCFFACSVAGCSNNPTTLLKGSVDAMGLGSGQLFWTTGSTPVLNACRLPECSQPFEFASSQAPNATAFGTVTADDQDVYWVADGTILTCPTGGCGEGPTMVKSAEERYPLHLAIRDDTLCFNRPAPLSNTGEILCCPRTGCADSPTVVAQALSWDLDTDGSYVYWTESGPIAGLVRKCPVTGCNGSPVTIAYGLASPVDLVVDEQNVYWIEMGAGKIWKAPK